MKLTKQENIILQDLILLVVGGVLSYFFSLVFHAGLIGAIITVIGFGIMVFAALDISYRVQKINKILV